MASNIQHTLANLEMAPPQGSWDQLSARLDAEYDLPEIALAQKLDAAALQPPANAWAAIAAAIPSEAVQPKQTIQPTFTEEATPAKVVPFSLKKIAVAAAVLGIIALGSWYLLRTNSAGIPPVQQSVAAQKENEQPASPSSIPQPAVAPPVIAQKEHDQAVKPLRASDKNEQSINAATAISSTDIGNDAVVEEITPANPVTVKATATEAPATIPDRPYRDARGKVVMDMNLLNNPGTQYVTVTAPNGEQTRINKKFLPVLTFLNTGADNGQFNNTLKQRFQKWRNQLIQQASFVPSATNFLDIMELKELLQDK
ncbi:hypothetical protein HHL16_19335 [Pseudoflavitalea sp. G-6-1-2]|uniref:hypothetical protein n=1 Tax=Pseudoflavitalea sp. G-6-1-2 TaxID=2728841 RepID=UPI00146EA0FA|nr:hypothetical protein [Pseudoflavitalea sp. G-6-1-2]NML23040.1 hypothetical protein [Pseudoflavitalea sp. G-6-1-2]